MIADSDSYAGSEKSEGLRLVRWQQVNNGVPVVTTQRRDDARSDKSDRVQPGYRTETNRCRAHWQRLQRFCRRRV